MVKRTNYGTPHYTVSVFYSFFLSVTTGYSVAPYSSFPQDERQTFHFFTQKVKVTLKQAVKAQRGEVELQLYYFFDHGPRWGWVDNATPRPLYPQERDPLPIIQEVEWAPRLVLTSAENLADTGIRSPD